MVWWTEQSLRDRTEERNRLPQPHYTLWRSDTGRREGLRRRKRAGKRTTVCPKLTSCASLTVICFCKQRGSGTNTLPSSSFPDSSLALGALREVAVSQLAERDILSNPFRRGSPQKFFQLYQNSTGDWDMWKWEYEGKDRPITQMLQEDVGAVWNAWLVKSGSRRGIKAAQQQKKSQLQTLALLHLTANNISLQYRVSNKSHFWFSGKTTSITNTSDLHTVCVAV